MQCIGQTISPTLCSSCRHNTSTCQSHRRTEIYFKLCCMTHGKPIPYGCAIGIVLCLPYDKLELKLKFKLFVAGGVQRQRSKGKALLFPLLKLKHFYRFLHRESKILTVPQHSYYFYDINISQGSVATRLNCGGIFIANFL